MRSILQILALLANLLVCSIIAFAEEPAATETKPSDTKSTETKLAEAKFLPITFISPFAGPPPEELPVEPLIPPSAIEGNNEKIVLDEKVIYPWYFYKAWTGSIDVGANGSEGNSQSFNLRTGVNLKRDVPWRLTSVKLDYIKTSSNSITTANRLFFDGRDEWPFENSPWSLYIHETTEYDEFRAFDVRVTGDAGISYQIFKNEIHSVKGRFGPGVSREFGGTNDEWTPELVFGLIYDWQISKKQKFNMQVDYFPQVDSFNNYRINSQINWQVVIDEVNNLSLKVGIVDRYDSTPEGKKPNDLDYKTVLVWSF
jgi:putative salt-induced outer membrane protein YdiY